MGTEIERKFLVHPTSITTPIEVEHYHIKQGILPTNDPRIITRVRVVSSTLGPYRQAMALLTIKGPQKGLSRKEFEYPIPETDAVEMLDELCGDILEKTRYLIPVNTFTRDGGGSPDEFFDRTLEIDVFHGDNDGLILAEVELESQDEEVDWDELNLEIKIIKEVSQDHRYSNSNLISHPWKNWGPDEIPKGHPKTVDEAVDRLISGLQEEDKEVLVSEVPDFVTIQSKIQIGRWIRNNFGLWEGNPELTQDSGKHHPDDVSGVILDRMIEKLKTQRHSNNE